MENKRRLPDREKMNERIKYMEDMQQLTPIKPANLTEPNGLESGNSKTGNNGSVFEKIFVWNLPPVITCPGISDWCRQNCYNADNRYEKFPIFKWCENLWWVLNDKEKLCEKISLQLKDCKKRKAAVRIHSSGDFFSKDYIAFWKDIIRKNPNIYFWAYTRSWAVDELVDDIIGLNVLDNMNLILSWDETMVHPIDGFAKSIVYSSNEEINLALERKDGIVCPEQYGLVSSCADCGICISGDLNNIYFILH